MSQSHEPAIATRAVVSVRLSRVVAALVTLVLIPAMLTLGALREAGTFQVGAEAPRTIRADESIRIVDEDATVRAREVAAETVDARTAADPEARVAIVNQVRGIFEATVQARAAREALEPGTSPPSPGPTPTSQPDTTPLPEEQAAALQAQFEDLRRPVARALVALDDDELADVRADTVDLAQEFARRQVSSATLTETLEEFLSVELPLLALPDDAAETIVGPVIEQVARPTIVVDVEATQLARAEAAEAVEPIAETWQPGDAIVTMGEPVGEIAYLALQQSGLEGSPPRLRFLRALGAMAVVMVVIGIYLWRMQPQVWRSPRKLLLLAALITGHAVVVTGLGLFTTTGEVAWWYLVPVGALAMLIALLVHPVVAIASMLPAVVLVTLSAPLSNGVAVFTAAAVLVSVPLTIRLQSRADLRSATFRAGVAMPVIAALTVGVFGPRTSLWQAIAAAAVNGLLIVLLVQGLLPFLENLFRLPTVTALLDLADRNHPLLRELETKALGTYNHSVMVAALTERACREIGADPLLGSVAALYHDIGKVRRPHFFIENQYGIANPHDELEPQVSAVIIQEHVIDGVRMATEYRLPPEVVAAIGSHHGTMVVSFFYSQAVKAADGDESQVDKDAFRYKGSKPHAKEAAVLVIADCSEATTRSMAMTEGTLSRDAIETTVDSLIHDRVNDGQFDESDLTFDELRRVRDSVVEALVGIYHPRIAYPSRVGGPASGQTETTPEVMAQQR